MDSEADEKRYGPMEEGQGASVIRAWKGFDRDLRCRDHQFAVGETYVIDDDPVICERGFHACEHPLDVLTYYPAANSRFAEVRLHGAVVRHDTDSKIAASRIEIVREVTYADLWREHRHMVNAVVTEASATGYSGNASATGVRGHASATGDRGHASATGDRGHASATGYSGHASATGDSGHASATGDRGHASATGVRGHASATGAKAIAVAIGRYAQASAIDGGWIVLAHYDNDWNVVAVKTARCGDGGLKPGTYTLDPETGDFVEVGSSDVENTA